VKEPKKSDSSPDTRQDQQEAADARLQALEPLLKLAGFQGRLSSKKFAHLMAKGQALGVSANHCQDYLIRYCKNKRWRYELSSADQITDTVLQTQRTCPYCTRRIKAEAIKCRFCNKYLKPETQPAQPRPARLTNALGMEFVLIQPGSFLMGSPKDEQSWRKNDTQHEVTLTRAFYLQTTPVTQAQWQAVMGNNPSRFPGDPRCPVECVSWDDVQDYIQKLEQQLDGEYHLPTEAEWEYACRAGRSTTYYFGNNPAELTYYAWYEKNSGDLKNIWQGLSLSQEMVNHRPHPVGLKKPNAWGLYDMLGNVNEWVQDCQDYPYALREPHEWVSDWRDYPDPFNEHQQGTQRVCRGGNWHSSPEDMRCASRSRCSSDLRLSTIGFRLVLRS